MTLPAGAAADIVAGEGARRPLPTAAGARGMLHGRALRYIDEVARTGSIRKAAKTLNVAASAINRHVLEIEQELDAPIFERLPRGLRLTTTGEMLVAHIRETLRNHERMRAQIESLRGLSRGEVTIATMATLAAGRLADVAADFRAAHPQIVLKVRVGDRAGITEAVADGEVDLGLGYNLAHDPRLQRVWEVEHRLGAVVAPDHPLTARKLVRVSDCLAFPLVLADARLSLREVVQNLAPANTHLVAAVETNSMEMMKRLARHAPHVTFLNRVDVDQEIRDGDLVFLPLIGAAGRQRLLLVQRARGTLGPAASRFAQALEAGILPEPDAAQT